MIHEEIYTVFCLSDLKIIDCRKMEMVKNNSKRLNTS